MTEKKTNVLSRSLTEAFIRKQWKAFKKSPDKTLQNLADMAAAYTKEPLREILSQITKGLQDKNSGYSRLLCDILAYVSPDHFITFGMNVGYNGLAVGSAMIRENEKKLGISIPWSLTFYIDNNECEETISQWKSLVMERKKLGVYSYFLHMRKNAWKLLPFIKKEENCAFVLFCPASCLTEKFLDAAKKTHNLLISVEYGTGSEQAFRELRQRKLPYAVHLFYGDADAANIISGRFLAAVSKKKPVFTFFIPKEDFTEETSVYEYIVSERNHLKYPTIPFELERDTAQIDRMLSS